MYLLLFLQRQQVSKDKSQRLSSYHLKNKNLFFVSYILTGKKHCSFLLNIFCWINYSIDIT